MPVPIIETCRKRKRKPKVYSSQRFGEDGVPIYRSEAFRDQIRVFLRDCAEVEEYSVLGMPVWCTLLSHETTNSVVPLYTVEEDVARSSEPYCDQCRCTGWSNHFVSKRKYHFIIPVDSEWNMPLEDDVFDLQSHLLHGLIHSNGFGHLICINGMEGDSKYLCGREIVDLWDRICNILGARMITVEDFSKKRSMELRLLYGVAYGHSWFGRWGYKFSRGSYGVTKNDYENAIELLGSLDLNQIEFHFGEYQQSKEIKQVIRYYREMSEGNLRTFRDLLRFMLIIKSHASPQKLLPATPPILTDSPHPKRSSRLLLKKSDIADNDKSPKYRRYSTVAANLGSRWPVRRLIFAAEVIVESLKEMKAMKPNGMTRQDVRDSARLHIGDTGLLDYVLKSMHNVVVGNVLVRRYVDPVTRILHYTIQELDDAMNVIEPKKEEAVLLEEITPLRIYTPLKPGADVYGDLLLLYTNVLLNYPESELLVRSATQAILDSKHFVKEWPIWDNSETVLQFVCRINPSLIGLRSEQMTELPPGELVTVPLQATVFDLKQAIEETFRDTYCILANFVVSEIEEVTEDMSLTESCSALTVRGYGIDLESKLKCQGGCDTWMVRCICRARDDDGERMISCDVCEVWQHTRCCGIDDSDTLPPLFVCSNCCEEFAEQQRKVLQPKYEFPSSENMFLIESADDFYGDQSCLGLIFPEENYLL
ncbi:PREDICTED: PHD finger protein MALE MEIOCYTE DEATH 1 [Camelina sativa]|uniref:PHD finger protein MALE MEIOCYTE DEATH 1 n=1 Tax=Camelina sativa TaxID=90675 RepID=A0ABM0Z7L3_CAMSA|nr:PREDICTED: PHD finger protein MALE MEIOCYTE DEATH 1 [Camelina sativa]